MPAGLGQPLWVGSGFQGAVRVRLGAPGTRACDHKRSKQKVLPSPRASIATRLTLPLRLRLRAPDVALAAPADRPPPSVPAPATLAAATAAPTGTRTTDLLAMEMNPNAAGATAKVAWPARPHILPRDDMRRVRDEPPNPAEQGLTTPPVKPTPHVCPNAPRGPIRKKSLGRKRFLALEADAEAE